MNEEVFGYLGACIEFSAANKIYVVSGEDIERRTGHVSLRSIAILTPRDNQTLTRNLLVWELQIQVDTNSGVLNHWFYILAVGKSGTNDISLYVTGITVAKAEKIAYRLESVYLTVQITLQLYTVFKSG
jgi:Zn-dependent metalloprotease